MTQEEVNSLLQKAQAFSFPTLEQANVRVKQLQLELTASQARVKELESPPQGISMLETRYTKGETLTEKETKQLIKILIAERNCGMANFKTTNAAYVRCDKRIATLEQALREADTWARAEQAVIDCPEYSEKVQRALRSELEVPVGFKTIGDYLDRLRQKVITTISAALNEKEGK